MGSFANTLFTIMLGWLQSAAAAIWSALTTENGSSFLQWIGRNWLILTAVLCAIGLVADFGIYLVRWRPMRVWKSFFSSIRRSGSGEEPEQESTEKAAPVQPGRLFRNSAENEPANDTPGTAGETEQADFSRWQKEEPEPEDARIPAGEPVMITGAGYTVPADSPYRRPAEPQREDETSEPPFTEEIQSGKPAVMTQRKRRRRLIVSDLFTDPEEELYPHEKPQQLIDRNKAYHQPVYPRGWKKNEGDSQ